MLGRLLQVMGAGAAGKVLQVVMKSSCSAGKLLQVVLSGGSEVGKLLQMVLMGGWQLVECCRWS